MVAILATAALGEKSDENKDPRFPLKWETYVGLTTFRTTILSQDGKIAIASNGDSYGGIADPKDGVYLLDAETGNILKHLRDGSTGDKDVNGIAWYDDILFFGDDSDRLYAYDESGERRWQIQVEGDIEGAPALADLNGDDFPDVISATEAGFVYVFDGRNGELIWKFQAQMEPQPGKYEYLESVAFMASPAVADLNDDDVRDVLIGSRNATFYALDGRNGEPLWKYHTFSGIHSSAIVTTAKNDLRIAFAESYSRIHLLDRLGQPHHEVELTAPRGGIQGLFASPVITATGSILIGSAWWDSPDQPAREDGYWLVHPFANIREDRNFLSVGRISATPFLADVLGEFYPQVGFVTENGWIQITDGRGAIAVRWKMPAGSEATPLVADVDGDGQNELLIATRDGYLRCYDTAASGRIEWGQFRGNNHNTGVMNDTLTESASTSSNFLSEQFF